MLNTSFWKERNNENHIPLCIDNVITEDEYDKWHISMYTLLTSPIARRETIKNLKTIEYIGPPDFDL